MEIDVLRYSDNGESTLGLIFINTKFDSNCLEDAYHEEKIKGKTRIPAGRYKLGIRTEGRLHDQYSIKFPSFHKGMIHILNIPNFSLVYFHIGNKSEDTEGCPLVGNIVHNNEQKIGQILESTIAYEDFYRKVIIDVMGGQAWANFHDLDRNYYGYIKDYFLTS